MTMQTAPSSSRPASLLALAGLLVLAGCDGERPLPLDAMGEADLPASAADAAIAEAPDRDCLLVVWDQQEAPDRDFDRANDLVEGGLISCATGTSASQYAATLAEIREAAAQADRDTLLAELQIPLLFIDQDGERISIDAPEMANARFEDVFTPDMLALLTELELEDMTVVPDQGGFFGLGAIWLTPGEPGGKPQLVTVNRQALLEARSASETGS